MFKDIRLSINGNAVMYDYKIVHDKIFITSTDKLKVGDILKIFYDENIFEINFDSDVSFYNGKAGEVFVNLLEEQIKFYVILKINFYVKSVYKYINKLISIDDFIDEIKIFMISDSGKKYIDNLNKILNLIYKQNIDILTDESRYEGILDILMNEDPYIKIIENMSECELMLLITSYISVPFPPKFDQGYFDKIVNAAINYDYALENVWRLAMN